MKLRSLSKVLGALIFLGMCIFCIPGVYDSFLTYFNEKGIWGSIFHLTLQLASISIVLTTGFAVPLSEAKWVKTKEEKREVWFCLSTSLNLALIPTFIVGLVWYDGWIHSIHHHYLLMLFWTAFIFTATINMMRSKSTQHFKGLRLVKSDP